MSEGVRLYAGTQAGLTAWRSGTNGWQEIGRHFEDGIIDSIFGCTTTPERVFVGVSMTACIVRSMAVRAGLKFWLVTSVQSRWTRRMIK